MKSAESTEVTERRKQYLRRWARLKEEREPYLTLWRELAANFAPMSALFDEDRNSKRVKRNRLLNSSPVRAGRVLAAGMMTSITSPARKWFKLSKPFSFMVEAPRVRSWLEDVENGLFQIFARSNLYSALSMAYQECGIFGTHAFFVDEDDEDLVRAYPLPIGTYCLAASERRSVDTLYREVWLTTAQMVRRFGLDACSQHVRMLWNSGDRDTSHCVLHIIEPNKKYILEKADYRKKPYDSVWLEIGSEATGFLHEGGFEEFPVMAPRWSVIDNNVYGADSPGMVALGDAKMLQAIEKASMKMLENGADPALVASSSMRNQKISLKPADVTFGDSTNGAPAVQPMHQTPPHWVSILQNKIQNVEDKIASAFFVDLFLGLSESDRREITAEEIRARQQEKMLQLGPVLERLNDELLDPLIDRVFSIAYRKGFLPPAPDELSAESIRVEYLSILTQAQKTIGVSAVNQFLAAVAGLAPSHPEILDKINWDRVVDDLAEMYGVPPRELQEKGEVDAIRQQRAEQAAMQQQMAVQMAQAEQAKTLSEARTDRQSALSTLLSSVSGPMGAASV